MSDNHTTAEEGKDGGVNFDRQITFAPEPVNRKATFSRAFTFDGTYVRDGIQQPFSKLTRTLSEVAERFDPDAKFTKAVIEDYTQVANEGNEGDIPFPDGFANTFVFWKVTFFTIVVAVLMGILSSAFMNFIDEIPKQWDTCDYSADKTCGDWYNGQLYWIAITTGGGFCVGLIRWAFYYPDNLPGLFKDVVSFHVDPKWIVFTYTISAISLACGATLGPEQALGNMGGGIATFLTHYIDFGDEDYNKVFILAGMAAPLGALFPSPLLGTLMMHELGDPPKTFMESTIILSVASCVCFAIYYEMVGVTYIEHFSSNQVIFSYNWLESGYQNWQFGTGILVGVMSAILCIAVLLTIGTMKQIFFRLRSRLAWSPFLKEICPPTLGGLAIGLVNWALPATVGTGGLELAYFPKYGGDPDNGISAKLLACTGFARMFLLAVSMNCGFVGGIIFPFLTMGVIAGSYMYRYYSYIPEGLCIGTFMVSLACGIVPIPFTFSCLSIFLFYFGVEQTVPIFLSCFICYWIVSGTGLLKALVSRNQQAASAGDATPRESSKAILAESDKAKKDAENYALQQYLGRKKDHTANPIHS